MPESVASEVVSAMVGGMFSASALYPLEVLKTRMQAESKVSSGNNPQEETDDDEHGTHNGGGGSNSGSGAGGGGAGGSKQQLKTKYSNAAQEGMTSYAALMYQHEGGIAPFYSGVVTSAVQSATEKALYFFAYTFFKNG
jgi:adenine nucleotide transporter 17